MTQDLLTLFAARRAADPDARAVVDDQSARTYADLDAEAAGYAELLARQGVGRETVVAVVAGRGPRYVAMVLGVLRAGGAFLPVEPTTPARRARQMCETAHARVLLVEPGRESYAAELADGTGRVVVPAVSAVHEPAERAVARNPEGLAYVIFTSGSTGAPKGAMVVDGGMDNHMAAKVLDLGLGPDDVVGLTAPLSFDISVWQSLTALTVGATVAVASPLNLSEPVELVEWVRRHGVTVLEIVPSFLTVLVDELGRNGRLRAALGSLRLLIATGEALPADLARRWYEQCPDIAVMNAYGPTECSDDVTHHTVTRQECETRAWPPIGREIINTRVHILDDQGRETDGEGELFVGGRGVGRGYVGDPVRTALAFVPDHLSGEPGRRLYRTGDRGSRAAGGAIDFHGRRDRQVKVRGHRIELGDVESELLRAPGVVAAACVFTLGRLHAFVTLGVGATGDGVLPAVRAAAPAYLVPHEVTVLDRLPTTTAGKVDHRALRDRAAGRADGQAPADGSALAAVRALASDVLGVATVAADDDFFSAGGDSMLAMKLLSLARERFGVEDVRLRGFLADPTPQGLLGELDRARAAPPVAPVDLATGALSSGQERLWFLEQLNPRKNPLLIRLEFTLLGSLDERALQHALAAVVARHEPLRTVFSQERGVPVATVLPSAEVTVRRSASAAGLVSEVVAHAELSARTRRPPLMAAGLARIAPDHHVLVITLHHLVADGWTLAVLRDEITTFYQRWLDGDTDVPAPRTTFSSYVATERQWLAGPEAKEAEEYWARMLDGAATIDLPLDRPRPARPDFTTGNVVVRLTEDETSALAAVARARKATPFMAAMAAFYAVLSTLTGSRDLVIGIDSVNRSWPGSEELIGTFVNQLPVRIAAAEDAPTFAELLELTRQRLLGAYAHDRLPFHKIVAAVNPPRKAGRFPLFQVKLTHQSAWQSGVSLRDLEVVPSEISDPVMDADLMLDITGETSMLRLELLYLPELLDQETAAAWADAIAAVLRAGAANPGAPVAVAEGVR
jgi:mycobactin peptide synthetase MbtE